MFLCVASCHCLRCHQYCLTAKVCVLYRTIGRLSSSLVDQPPTTINTVSIFIMNIGKNCHKCFENNGCVLHMYSLKYISN